MKIFKNKFLVKLIATICLFLTLFNFAGTSKVYAEEKIWGGTLLTPIIDLMKSVGDFIMEILHESIQDQRQAIIKVDTDGDDGWALFGAVVVSIVVAVAFIAAVVASAGAVAAVAATVTAAATFTIPISLGTVVAGAAVGVIAGTSLYSGWIADDIFLPAFSITAEEIFANRLLLFDINFFEPKVEIKEIYKGR